MLPAASKVAVEVEAGQTLYHIAITPSEDQFQRELNLAGSPGGMIDKPEARAAQDIHGQREVDQVKGVEELTPKLQREGFRAGAAAQGGIFDQGEIEIVQGGAAEGIAPQGSEASQVGAGPPGDANRDGEERGIISALAEIILTNGSRGGKDRRAAGAL